MFLNKFNLIVLFICLFKFSNVQLETVTNNYLLGPIVEDNETIEFELTKNPDYGLSDNLNKLHVKIDLLNDYRLRTKITDANSKRFEVPLEIDLNKQKPNLTTRLYEVKIGGHNEDSSILKVIRKKTNTLIWSINLGELMFSDQFIQIQSDLTSFKLFGLAEHMDTYLKEFRNEPKTLLFYNQGDLPRPEKALYGSHPTYLNFEPNGYAHSVFLMNSNAMEIILNPNKTITYRVLGGILDFHVNVGPSPKEAVKQYINLVGKPPLVPYSAIGFHICRWGYPNLASIKKVVQRTIDAGIPYDYQWADIDYMNQHDDFTVDYKNFAGLKEFIEELHTKNMRFGIILDPGLPENLPESEYPPFTEALKSKILVTYPNGELASGKVWNRNLTVFPDFTNPKTEEFWTSNLIKLNKKIDYSMLWIDMNEIALIEDEKNFNRTCNYKPPNYIPKGMEPLHYGTLCYDAEHHIGNHAEVHNIYAYFQAKMTRNALLKMNKRPFIISRSTFAGSGRFTSHWTGDVYSQWRDLKLSVSNMLEFNILGIPVVGADICGFVGEPTEELCARWQSVGAFYPFSRNHNTINTKDQDPVAMGSRVEESARYSLRLRYSLLPLLYTELWKASINGTSVVNSLSLLYPEDEKSFIEDQFLWGESLMVIPILEEGKTTKEAYLPKGLWYDFTSNMRLLNKDSKNGYVTMQIPLDRIKLAVRGGSILFTQQPKRTTTETRLGNYTVYVAMDENSKAKGEIYIDDGESIIKEKNHEYSFVKADFNENKLKLEPIVSNYKISSFVDKIIVAGIKPSNKINNLYIDGKLENLVSKLVKQESNDDISYEIVNLSIDLNKSHEIRWN